MLPIHPHRPAPSAASRDRAVAPSPRVSMEISGEGRLRFEFRDGVRKLHHPDDSVVHKRADGAVTITFGHGVVVNRSREGLALNFPDGGCILRSSWGCRVIAPIPALPDPIPGAAVERLDGGHRVRIRFPDRVVEHDSYGKTVTWKFLPRDTPASVPNRFETCADGRHRAWREE